MAEIVVVFLVLIVGGVVEGCSRGWIPRNNVAGIRLPPLFESDWAWREGRRAARFLTWCGVAMCVSAQVGALFMVDESSQFFVLLGVGVLSVALLAASVRAWHKGKAVATTP